jgi:hypothetical protein
MGIVDAIQVGKISWELGTFGRLYLGKWCSPICDASALGSTTGNNTFASSTSTILCLLDQLGELFMGHLAILSRNVT